MQRREATKIMMEITLIAAIAIVFKATVGRTWTWIYGESVVTVVPLIFGIFAYRRGVKTTFVASIIYLAIQLITVPIVLLPGKSWYVVALDFLLEYPISIMTFSIAGIWASKVKEGRLSYFVLGILVVGLIRWVIHSMAGVVFWSDTLPEQYQVTRTAMYYYSFIVYNTIILIDTGISIVLGVIVFKRVRPIILKEV